MKKILLPFPVIRKSFAFTLAQNVAIGATLLLGSCSFNENPELKDFPVTLIKVEIRNRMTSKGYQPMKKITYQLVGSSQKYVKWKDTSYPTPIGQHSPISIVIR